MTTRKNNDLLNNPKEISKLSNLCFELIKEKPSIEKQAFEFLNFRNAHPSSLIIYSDYFQKKKTDFIKI